MKRIILAAAAVLLSTSIAQATVVSYDISWIGANNYSLTGSFSFDDATAGTTVDETELTAFSIEGFLSGGSIGTYSGPVSNFNFDATTGQFLVGGFSASGTGQEWNLSGGGIGFGSGSGGQLLSLDGIYISDSFIDIGQSTLLAELAGGDISSVPLPAALPLFGAAMALLGFLGWRRKEGALKTA